METVGVVHCGSCGALVNARWPACAVCQEPLHRYPSLTAGCLVWWQGTDGLLRGPALLRGTLDHGGQIWGWFVFEGTEYLIDIRLIVKIQEGSSE